MEFRMNEKGEPSKAALAMFDPKGERVNFAEECMCDGPVETWLNGVVDAMKEALFHEFTHVRSFTRHFSV
jgi:dynein heavy chain